MLQTNAIHLSSLFNHGRADFFFRPRSSLREVVILGAVLLRGNLGGGQEFLFGSARQRLPTSPTSAGLSRWLIVNNGNLDPTNSFHAEECLDYRAFKSATRDLN